jgi:hypothetical protein
MGLVMNKAKRRTMADLIHGAGIIGLLVVVGIYIYLPISKIIRSGSIGSIDEVFPFNSALMAPLPVFALSILLFIISAKLKIDGTWFSNTYDKLGPGVLLLILIFIVWVVLPLVGAAVEAIL